MAYIVSATQTATASAASYTVTLGAHVSGDLLLVALTNDGGGTAIAPDATSATAGWQMLGTQAASGGIRHAWAYLIADSASEVNPAFTGANDDWIGTCVVVRDAHATAPFGATPTSGTDFVRTDWNAVNSSASGALTTAVDECLLLYSWGSDGTGYMRCKLAEAVEVDKYATANISQIIALSQQQTAAAAPTVTMYHHVAVEGGNGWVLAIRNKSGGALQPDLRITATEPKWYGSWAAQHDGVTWQAPDQVAASIGGITCSATAPTVDSTNFWAAAGATYGADTRLTSTESTAGSWVGGSHTIASTDMTGKIFSIEMARTIASASSVQGTEGAIICFSDGTNWVAYQTISKAKGWSLGDPDRSFIALGAATAYASSGSIDWGAVTRVGYFTHRIGSSTGTSAVEIKNAVLFDTVAVTGGGSSRPATFTDLQSLINSWGCYRIALVQASAQILPRHDVQIGDGTNVTYFDGAAQSFEFPQAWYASQVANWQMNWNVNASQVALSVKASASDTIKLAAGVAATDTLQALTIDAASSTSATYDFGQSFVGWSPTWKTGVTCANATFSACAPVAFKGANVTSCIIKNTLATASEAAITFDANGATVTTSTIDVTGTSAGYHIALGASVTAITLNGVTLTGTPGTDKIYSALAIGTLTITADGTGTGLVAGDVTFVGGSTATAVIASPQVYQTVTISGATAGSRIQIYDTTSSTELYNGTPAFPYTWTDGSAAAADRAIRLRVAYVSGATAKEFIEASIGTCGQTAGTAAVSYLVNQTADSTYDTNAIDGPAIYATSGITFTDAATDLVNCNIAGGAVTWPTIYACFVYWLSTSTGIADDITYISAPDPANYLLTAMKIKNTNANPLTITGGFGRSATSGLVADIIDTAGSTGNIFPAPDHVVAYATGSALSAGQDAKLTAIDAVCTSFVFTSGAVQADIQRVNGYEVTGDGQTGTEWGPV